MRPVLLTLICRRTEYPRPADRLNGVAFSDAGPEPNSPKPGFTARRGKPGFRTVVCRAFGTKTRFAAPTESLVRGIFRVRDLYVLANFRVSFFSVCFAFFPFLFSVFSILLRIFVRFFSCFPYFFALSFFAFFLFCLVFQFFP